MTQLYDRERELGLYVAEERKDAADNARLDARLESIRNLMETMKMTAKQAMNALKIEPKDQKIYMPLLKK